MAAASFSPTLFAFPHPAAPRATLRRLSSFPCRPTAPPQVSSRPQRALTTVSATQNEQDAPFSLLNLPTWAKWVLGSLAWLIVPTFQRLQKLGDTIGKVDSVVERIEEVAEKADKIAEEMAESLPEGKLKDVVKKLEKVSEEVAKDAKMVDQVLDKVSDIVEDIESIKDEKKKNSY